MVVHSVNDHAYPLFFVNSVTYNENTWHYKGGLVNYKGGLILHVLAFC